MTNDQLTALLAERVMGWMVGPDRFMMANRAWISRWRFQPTEKLEDALRLLHEAVPQEFSICGDDKGNLQVRVRVGASTGIATGGPMAMVIAIAVARAVGLDVGEISGAVLDPNDGANPASQRQPRGK
jgi:hypothetical protein